MTAQHYPMTPHRVGPAYRVGIGRDLARLRMSLIVSTSWRTHWAATRYFAQMFRHRAGHRSYWGLWQAEHDGPEKLNARRALTARRARQKMLLALDGYDRGEVQR